MTSAPDDAELTPIREAVRALCAEFPGEYWRKLDRERVVDLGQVAFLELGVERRADDLDDLALHAALLCCRGCHVVPSRARPRRPRSP